MADRRRARPARTGRRVGSLARRTLPWERELDPQGLIPAPPPELDQMEPRPLTNPIVPWLALLVFTEDPSTPEAKVVTGVPLSSVITDAGIRARMVVTGDSL